MFSSDETKSSSVSVQKQVVIFRGIEESYPVGTDIVCKYTIPSTLEATSNGWIGLFRVGWRSLSDYIYFDWATLPSDYVKGMSFDEKIIFPANKLPNNDGEFYQFCYVTSSKGDVRGASTPFQFRSSGDISNFDLVEIEDENEELLIVKTKTTLLEDKLKSAEMAKMQIKKELEIAETEKKTLRLDHRKMLNYLVTLNQEGESKDSKLQENMELIGELKTQNSELNERLGSIQDKIDVLNQEKASMEKRLDDSDIYIVSLQEKIKNLVTDKEMLHVKVKNLEEEKEIYKKYMEAVNELKRKLTDEEMKNSQMRKEIDKLEMEVEMQRIQIQRQHDSRLADKETIDSLSERLRNAEDKLSAAEVCKSMLNEEVISVKKTYEREIEELSIAKAATTKLLHDNDTRNETTIQTLQKEISGLKKEILDLQQKCGKKEVELNELHNKISENTKMDDGGSLFALQIAYDALTDTYKNSCKKMDSLQRNSEQFKLALSEMEKFKDEQNKEIEGLRQRLLMGQETYQDKYVECERLRAQLARRSSLKASDGCETTDDSKTKVLSDVIRDLKHSLTESISTLKMERQENERLKSIVGSLNAEVNRLMTIIADRVKLSNAEMIKEMSRSHAEEFEKSNSEKVVMDERFEDALDIPTNVEAEYESSLENESIILFNTNVSNSNFTSKVLYNNDPTMLVNQDILDNQSNYFSDRDIMESNKSEILKPTKTYDSLMMSDRMWQMKLLEEEVYSKCPVCDFPFLSDMTEADIESHMMTHEPSQLCPICLLDFSEKSQKEFTKHVNSHF